MLIFYFGVFSPFLRLGPNLWSTVSGTSLNRLLCIFPSKIHIFDIFRSKSWFSSHIQWQWWCQTPPRCFPTLSWGPEDTFEYLEHCFWMHIRVGKNNFKSAKISLILAFLAQFPSYYGTLSRRDYPKKIDGRTYRYEFLPRFSLERTLSCTSKR